MDRHTSEQRRKNMKAVKSKNTKIELVLGKEMWKRGLRYRKNVKKIEGKPDFAFIGLKIAVFCDSEFWHGKNWGIKKHEIKSNQAFWHKKIEKNIVRDRYVNQKLNAEGWIVLRFWGKDILKSAEACADKVEEAVRLRKKQKSRNKNYET